MKYFMITFESFERARTPEIQTFVSCFEFLAPESPGFCRAKGILPNSLELWGRACPRACEACLGSRALGPTRYCTSSRGHKGQFFLARPSTLTTTPTADHPRSTGRGGEPEEGRMTRGRLIICYL